MLIYQRVPIVQRLTVPCAQIPSAAKEEQLPIIAPQSVITQMGDKVPRNGMRQPMHLPMTHWMRFENV
jgi:hypothetical protein